MLHYLLLPIAHAASYQFNAALPGNIGGDDPAGIIVNLYQFGMLLAGILAFGIIVAAGIQYSVSRGSPSAQSEARDRILQAFLGILLLVGAYTILYTLNPGLTNLQLPTLAPIPEKLTVERDYGGVPNDIGTYEEEANTPRSALPTTGGCRANPSNCVKLSDIGLQCSSVSCTADQNIARIINCALQRTGRAASTLRVGSAYPPAGRHKDPRHKNGCAVDIVITNANNCTDVNAFFAAAKSCGATGLNEYAESPLKCGVKSEHWTGNHLHINGCY